MAVAPGWIVIVVVLRGLWDDGGVPAEEACCGIRFEVVGAWIEFIVSDVAGIGEIVASGFDI